MVEVESSQDNGGPVFQWLGTAGFRIWYAGKVILIDPYLTRNDGARPIQALRPDDFGDTDFIFISHGHVDHAIDVPAIVEVSAAQVFCSGVAAETLVKHGVPESRITVLAGEVNIEPAGFGVRVLPTHHIVFDIRLVLKTLIRARGEIMKTARGARGWPAGPVLVYSFQFGRVSVTHLGSLGLDPMDVRDGGFPATDILLVPVQGHTDIRRRAAVFASVVGPGAVVPQHFDDFAPPLSQQVDLELFRELVKEWLPGSAYYEPRINARFGVEDIFRGEDELHREPENRGDDPAGVIL